MWHEHATPAAVPTSVLAASSGLVWFFDVDSGLITSLDPRTDTLHPEPATGGNAPLDLVEAPDGAIWWSDFLGGTLHRLDPGTGSVDVLPAPAGVHPLRGGFASDGSSWWGTDSAGTLLHVATDGMLTARAVPWASEIGDVGEGADGRLWMVANGGSIVAAYDPVGGGVSEYSIGASWTTALEPGTDGAVWIPDGDVVFRVDTTGAPLRMPIPGGEYVSDLSAGGPGIVLLDSTNRLFSVGSMGFVPLGTGAPGATARSISVSPAGVTWYADPLRGTLGEG